MGQGKTEAALYAAYRLLAAGQASGIYFALPTQLTSNKLYERFEPFLQVVLEPDCIHRQGLLLHGMAWLMRTQMGEEGRPGGDWFQQAKRGLLAPFCRRYRRSGFDGGDEREARFCARLWSGGQGGDSG